MKRETNPLHSPLIFVKIFQIILSVSLTWTMSFEKNGRPKISPNINIHGMPGETQRWSTPLAINQKPQKSGPKFKHVTAGSKILDDEEYYDELYQDEVPENEDTWPPPYNGWANVAYQRPNVYGAGWGTQFRDGPNEPAHIPIPASK